MSAAPSRLPVAKLHGCGNDFVLVDARRTAVDGAGAPLGTGGADARLALARRHAALVSDRHFGLGGDQLLVVADPLHPEAADLRMITLNADGSEAEMCGNGIRAFAHWAATCRAGAGLAATPDASLPPAAAGLRVETLAGIRTVVREGDAGYAVDMGPAEPSLAALGVALAELPHAPGAPGRGAAAGDAARPLWLERWPAALARRLTPAAGRATDAPRGGYGISMGNPHLVFFVDELDRICDDVLGWGRALERDPLFPRRINVSFVTVRGDGRLQARVWERGAGATLACGTAACAIGAAAQAHLGGGDDFAVVLPGGTLGVRVGERVTLVGPATWVAVAEIDLAAAAAAKEQSDV